MYSFDSVSFDEVYSELIAKIDFEKIVVDIYIPLLNYIGILWQTDAIKPAHEHFISNLISQKIQINTEKLQYSVCETGKTYVLFLPENEIHDLGLLYLNYELVLRGHHTVYLGQSLPLNNLNYFFDGNQEICFVTSMTVQPYDDKVLEYFNEIDEILKESKHSLIAIGKKAIDVRGHKFQSKISLHPTVTELLKVL